MKMSEAINLKDETVILCNDGAMFYVENGTSSDGMNRHNYLQNNKLVLVKNQGEDDFEDGVYAIALPNIYKNLGTKIITPEFIEAVKNEYPEVFV